MNDGLDLKSQLYYFDYSRKVFFFLDLLEKVIFVSQLIVIYSEVEEDQDFLYSLELHQLG